MIDVTDQRFIFHVLKKKLDEVQDDINYAFNMMRAAKKDSPCSFTLVNLEAKVLSARYIANNYLRKLEKGERYEGSRKI